MRIALFSLIEWDFVNQRPQAFARELAALGHEILYVEPPNVTDSMDLWAQRVEDAEIHTYRAETGITVCEGMLMPLRDPLQYSYNSRLATHVTKWLQTKDIDFSIVLSPEYSDSILLLGRPFAYDHVDETQFMDGIDTQEFVRCMNRLKEQALFNIYIQEPAAQADPKGFFLPNGTEAETFFPIDRPKLFDAVVLSTFAKWFDMDSVLGASSRILLIGPMDHDMGNNKERLFEARKPNLLWIPQLDKRTANLWLSAAEVGLVPFKLSHPVIPYAMPIKIIEYMLAGLRVVTYRSDGIHRFYGDRISYYGASTGDPPLDDAIAVARRQPQQRDFALQFDWKSIVSTLSEKIVSSVQNAPQVVTAPIEVSPTKVQEEPAQAPAAALKPSEQASFKKQIARLQDQLRQRTQWAASLHAECARRLEWGQGLEKWALDLEKQVIAKIEMERRLEQLETMRQSLLRAPHSWWFALAPSDLKQTLKQALAASDGPGNGPTPAGHIETISDQAL